MVRETQLTIPREHSILRIYSYKVDTSPTDADAKSKDIDASENMKIDPDDAQNNLSYAQERTDNISDNNHGKS